MLRFWILFLISMVIYYLGSITPTYAEFVEQPISSAYAWIASGFLNLFGYGISVDGTGMSGKLFSMGVAKGCDAVAPIVMLSAAILFYPYGSIANKWKGIVLGIGIVFVVNLIRLISLYLLGVHAPDWFDFFHVEFWQAVFIMIAMVYFVFWIKKDSR